MLAQHFPQSGLQQMGSGVIAHSGLTDFGVDHSIDFLAHANRLLRRDLVCAYSLDRVVAAFHFGDDGIVIVAVEPSAVDDLSSGFGVEGSVVEDDLAFISWLEFLCALTFVDDGENFTPIGTSLAVAFEVRFGKLLVSRIGSLLGCALPGGASAFALLLHGAVEAFLIELHPNVSDRILNEIQG